MTALPRDYSWDYEVPSAIGPRILRYFRTLHLPLSIPQPSPFSWRLPQDPQGSSRSLCLPFYLLFHSFPLEVRAWKYCALHWRCGKEISVYTETTIKPHQAIGVTPLSSCKTFTPEAGTLTLNAFDSHSSNPALFSVLGPSWTTVAFFSLA